jgi:2-methylcitrate dehydratase PrpD
MVQQLRAFAAAADWRMLSEAAAEALKLRILDALGCAVGALGSHYALAALRIAFAMVLS